MSDVGYSFLYKHCKKKAPTLKIVVVRSKKLATADAAGTDAAGGHGFF